ncbi:unnamed protein product [Chrysodeixis includens]|uniref:Uncharacterized protein n=1 Tax=Chrysodeixis includens TaxID=689277 RepID=A0A9P0FV88_CHRIL|nr:unnamed protein product [Chrysodeixis includens]
MQHLKSSSAVYIVSLVCNARYTRSGLLARPVVTSLKSCPLFSADLCEKVRTALESATSLHGTSRYLFCDAGSGQCLDHVGMSQWQHVPHADSGAGAWRARCDLQLILRSVFIALTCRSSTCGALCSLYVAIAGAYTKAISFVGTINQKHLTRQVGINQIPGLPTLETLNNKTSKPMDSKVAAGYTANFRHWRRKQNQRGYFS